MAQRARARVGEVGEERGKNGADGQEGASGPTRRMTLAQEETGARHLFGTSLRPSESLH
jgi:hypothetical protein